MMVRMKYSDDYTVIGPSTRFMKFINSLRSPIGNIINKIQNTHNHNYKSGNWLFSRWAKIINDMDVDVVHIHWVGAETLSIEDIGRIKKPIVWTLHDMWPFCGLEHYTSDDSMSRWRNGYSRTDSTNLLDLDNIVWRRKNKSWKKNINIVSPSNWLLKCVSQSSLFKSCNQYLIPNILDVKIFKPLNRNFCREVLNLDTDKKIILFGAFGGSADLRKGYDLLLNAIRYMATSIPVDNIQCLIFGQSRPATDIDLPIEIKWLGHVHDSSTLALIYNAANVMVVPSRQENLPQTATEAQACGCPVVAFDCTGFPDIVEHKVTGYLAKPYEHIDLATGIAWVIEDSERESFLGDNATNRAKEKWSEENTLLQYCTLYKKAILDKTEGK